VTLLLEQSAPVSGALASAPMAFACVAAGLGLVLWLVGGRLMRGVTALAFVGGGGFAGYAFVPDLSPGLPPWVGMCAGVLVGLILGAVMFRVSMAAALALMLGVAAPTTIAVGQNLHTAIVQRSSDSGRTLLGRAGLAALTGAAAAPRDSESAPADAPILTQAANFAGELSQEAMDEWDKMPISERSVLFLAAIGSAALGLGIGLLVPQFAASAVTAGLGAAVWLAAGAAIVHLGKPSFEQRLPERAIIWLVIWIGVTSVGVPQVICAMRPNK
jgi:hypothetical protein